MRRKGLSAALVGGVAIFLLPCVARADAGIPMLPVAYPVVLLLLLPVIAIEAIYLRRKLQTKWWPTIRGVSIVNAVTLLIGYPLAWGISFSIELMMMFSMEGLEKAGVGHWLRPAVGWLGLLVPAWIGPTERMWPVLVAFVILLLPSFLVSGFIETHMIDRYALLGQESNQTGGPLQLMASSRDTSEIEKRVKHAVWWANVCSYVFLAVVGCGLLGLYLRGRMH
jgi:hypothetical protein